MLSKQLNSAFATATFAAFVAGIAPSAALSQTLLQPKASLSDAAEFHELLRSTLPLHMQVDQNLNQIHLLPDVPLMMAYDSITVGEAMKHAEKSSLDDMLQVTNAIKVDPIDADAALRIKPLTIVIVPGVFGEFIPTRAFEEVLSQPSQDREDFAAKVAATGATDSTYDVGLVRTKSVPLTDVIHVGSLKDSRGASVVRVVLLATELGSFETLGDNKSRAQIFNRRLEKYFALTGPQRVALVGYSRGTPLGLEMLAQAQAANARWLSSVEAMVSLGGVVWGSALADDALNPAKPARKAIDLTKTLRKEMDPSSFRKNYLALRRWRQGIVPLLAKLNEGKALPKDSSLKFKPLNPSLDPNGVISILSRILDNFDLWTAFGSGFAPNVLRAQAAIDALVMAVEELSSEARLEWWAKNTLPQSIRYYSLSGVNANPERGAFEKRLFNGVFGYSNRSFDDLMLLQNARDYTAVSKVAVNDSQVSVPQTKFLPSVIAQLNIKNAGLKTADLGIASTHHWGLALRVVNEMRDGRQNPYPREALLKALAAKINLDSQK